MSEQATANENGYRTSEEEKQLIVAEITRPRGRRSKLTREMIEELAYSIVSGLTYKDACDLAGIDPSTFYKWLQQGEEITNQADGERTNVPEADVIFFDFFNTITKAKPYRKRELLRQLGAHGKTQWTALAWLLERGYPDEFGRRTRVDIVDWRSEVIELIKSGLDFDVIAESVGETETRRLFVQAGVAIPEGGADESSDDQGQGESGVAQEQDVSSVSGQVP